MPFSCSSIRLCHHIHSKSAVVRRMGVLRQAKWRRDELGEILVKGREQIENVLRSTATTRFRDILISDRNGDHEFIQSLGLAAKRLHRVDSRVLYQIVYQSRPLRGQMGDAGEGLDILHDAGVSDSLMLGTLPMPRFSFPNEPKFLLCLDGVIFPENVGSLIRSAAAVGGIDGILATSGTCDFYGWKVLESSKCLGFTLPKFRLKSTEELVGLIQEHNLLPVVGNANSGIRPSELDLGTHKGVVLIVGNEKHGPSKQIADLAVQVRIPIENTNSLNAGVAGGLLMQLVKASPAAAFSNTL